MARDKKTGVKATSEKTKPSKTTVAAKEAKAKPDTSAKPTKPASASAADGKPAAAEPTSKPESSDKPKPAAAEPKAKPESSAKPTKPAKPAEAKPESSAKATKPTEAKATDDAPADESGAGKVAPASSSPAAPRYVADADPVAPEPQKVSIPPETKAGEREVLLRPDQIDTDVSPTTKAPAPGRAPKGDARSLRRATEFCLIYRQNQYLVRREGTVGTLGNWSITEYPSSAAAAHAYAQECSELSGSGFADHRP